MTVIQLPSRLLARRRAEKQLWEGRRHVVALDPERAEAALRDAWQSARESGSVQLAAEVGEELYQVLLRRRHVDEAIPVLEQMVILRARRHGGNAELGQHGGTS